MGEGIKGNRLQEGRKEEEYCLLFSNADFFEIWEMVLKPPGQMKEMMTGLIAKKCLAYWPCATSSLPVVERKLVPVLWILFHLPATLKPLLGLSDSTWLWLCESFSYDRIVVEYERSCNLFLRWLFGTWVPWISYLSLLHLRSLNLYGENYFVHAETEFTFFKWMMLYHQ